MSKELGAVPMDRMDEFTQWRGSPSYKQQRCAHALGRVWVLYRGKPVQIDACEIQEVTQADQYNFRRYRLRTMWQNQNKPEWGKPGGGFRYLEVSANPYHLCGRTKEELLVKVAAAFKAKISKLNTQAKVAQEELAKIEVAA